MATNYSPRTVQLHADHSQLTEVAMAIGGHWDKLWHALGYLSSWNTSYPTVEIYQDGMTDFTAVYKDDKGDIKYVIGAVWHDTHYGFHS